MVGEEGRLAAVALHGHQHTASVRLHTDLLYRGVVSAQRASAGELQLDVTQLNVVHAVAGHPAAINIQISLISPLNLRYCKWFHLSFCCHFCITFRVMILHQMSDLMRSLFYLSNHKAEAVMIGQPAIKCIFTSRNDYLQVLKSFSQHNNRMVQILSDYLF